MIRLPSKNRVGIGIISYNRPDYLKQCLVAVDKHLKSCLIYVYDDGSEKPLSREFVPKGIHIYYGKPNKGVAKAKNWLFRKLLEKRCDYIFLLEDDIIIQSPKAVWGYIEAGKESGLHHLNFAHHGPANKGKPIEVRGKTAFYPNYVGAWSMYTAVSLKRAGLMDEHFLNAWEHVEHSFRMAKLHFTTWPLAADAKDSKLWLKEIPGSIDNSSIRPRSDWNSNKEDGYRYWEANDKDFPLKDMGVYL